MSKQLLIALVLLVTPVGASGCAADDVEISGDDDVAMPVSTEQEMAEVNLELAVIGEWSRRADTNKNGLVKLSIDKKNLGSRYGYSYSLTERVTVGGAVKLTEQQAGPQPGTGFWKPMRDISKELPTWNGPGPKQFLLLRDTAKVAQLYQVWFAFGAIKDSITLRQIGRQRGEAMQLTPNGPVVTLHGPSHSGE